MQLTLSNVKLILLTGAITFWYMTLCNMWIKSFKLDYCWCILITYMYILGKFKLYIYNSFFVEDMQRLYMYGDHHFSQPSKSCSVLYIYNFVL